MASDFEYDVAFSFTQQDEALAIRLADALTGQGRRTFVYSKHQEVIAGRDGELAFAEVFKLKARIVAVLLRDTWGQTPFTRIEETAIRGRGYDSGYDFCLMLPLDRAKPPEWFPKNRIWIGLERFGEASAVAVIESRCQESGGASIVPTLADRAAREQRALDHAARRQHYMGHEGVEAAARAFEDVCAALETGIAVLQEHSSGLGAKAIRVGRHFGVQANRPGMVVRWQPMYSNSLQEAKLYVEAYSGAPVVPGRGAYDTKVVKTLIFMPDVAQDGSSVWVSSDRKKELSSAALVDHVLHWWLDRKAGDGPQMFFV